MKLRKKSEDNIKFLSIFVIIFYDFQFCIVTYFLNYILYLPLDVFVLLLLMVSVDETLLLLLLLLEELTNGFIVVILTFIDPEFELGITTRFHGVLLMIF